MEVQKRRVTMRMYRIDDRFVKESTLFAFCRILVFVSPAICSNMNFSVWRVD